jgi:CHAT domain-containing protein
MRATAFVLLSLTLCTAAGAAQPLPDDEPVSRQEKAPPPVEEAQALQKQAAALDGQTVALYQKGRLRDAQAVAEKALALRRRLYPKKGFPAGHADLARNLNNLAFLLSRGGDYVRAEPLHREALAMRQALYPPERFPQGHADVANSLNNLGALFQLRGDYANAESFFRQTLAMRQKLYPPERFPHGHAELATGLTNLGVVLQARGDYPAAEGYCRQALAMDEKLHPPERFPRGHPAVATALNNLAGLLQARGALAQAEPYFRRALAMRQKLYPPERFPDGHAELASSLDNLASLLKARGEHAQAEDYCRKALAMRRQLHPPERFPRGHPDLALSLNNLGSLLSASGRQVPAEACYREALGLYERLYPAERFPRGHPHLASTLSNLGLSLYARRALAQAEPFYRRALALWEKLCPVEEFPLGTPELAQSLNNLGALLHDRGAYAEAEPYLRRALGMRQRLFPAEGFPQGHPHVAESLNNLGFLLLARGDTKGAERYLHKALAMQRRQLQALLAGSSEAQLLNHLAQAPRTRDGYLSVTRMLDETDAAFAAVWEARGVVARWLSQRRLAALAAADPKSRDVARRLAEKRQLLAALLLAREPLNADRARRVRRLSDEKEQLEKELAAALPAFGQARQSDRSSPQDLRARLTAGDVYVDLLRYTRIEYDPERPGLLGKRRTPHFVAFVLGSAGPVRRVELGPAAPIDQAVRAWRDRLAGGRTAALAPERELRRTAWEPLARRLPAGTTTVYLAPDGALTGLPWAALPGSKPGTVLLEEYALAVVPHGQFLLETLSASRGRQPPEDGTLVAVGAVAFDQASPAKVSAAGKDAKVVWPALPATARELERVVQLAGKRPARIRRGTDASAAQLLRDLPRARWAHVATHGFFADKSVRSVLQWDEEDDQRGFSGERVGVGARSPLVLSGLVLAGANAPVKDPGAEGGGILSAEAIAALNLDGLELAVLSACETGLGELAGGEGVFGLQRAFHVAGCKNVVASLWKVNDEATAALMALFYYHLWVEKAPPLEALRRSQLALYRHPERIGALARERGPEFEKTARLPAQPRTDARAPARLWAGFVLSGAGR